jgi:hypothetical protein
MTTSRSRQAGSARRPARFAARGDCDDLFVMLAVFIRHGPGWLVESACWHIVAGVVRRRYWPKVSWQELSGGARADPVGPSTDRA